MQQQGLLSQTATYALRAMAVLAKGADETTTAIALAREADVPPAYLAKIMRRLVVADLVRSQRGKGGGFTLARAPRDITFSAILEAVDAGIDEKRCAFEWGDCADIAPCPLHPVWSKLKRDVLTWANETRLSSIDVEAFDARARVKKRRPLRVQRT